MRLTSDLKYPYVEYVYNQKPYGNQGYPRWIHEQFNAEIADLKQQLNEARKDTERLREVAELLDLMYTKWENGDPCYEDIETHSGYLGSAFDLTKNEENRIIAALEAIDAAREGK